jgi:L-ascorbate metabolism protein UlaG (beta-lactamase superfamily)
LVLDIREGTVRAIHDATAGWDGASPLFLSIGINTWEMSPADVVRIADSLGPEFVVAVPTTISS